jgi:hypothetical protein
MREPTEREEGRDSKEEARDVMHGRDFAGANIAATEQEQTRDRDRAAQGKLADEAGEFVTDAEVEARELRNAEPNED